MPEQPSLQWPSRSLRLHRRRDRRRQAARHRHSLSEERDYPMTNHATRLAEATATLLEAFAAGADIHRHVAALVNGIDPAHVTPRQRNAAKAVNFGIIYGQTAFGLSQQLGIDR